MGRPNAPAKLPTPSRLEFDQNSPPKVTTGSKGGYKTGQRGRRCSRGVFVSFLFFSVFFLFFFFFVSVFILFFHFPASSSLSGTSSTFVGEIGTPEAWIGDGGA